MHGSVLANLEKIGRWGRTRLCRHLAVRYRIGDRYRRIYFYHVRKAAGTSVNKMFLSLGREDGGEGFARLSAHPDHCVISGGKIFVGWNAQLIEKGDYFYAFSHIPSHRLRMPKDTFTITCLRDPVDRVLSHYRMLLEFEQSALPHISFQEEREWLGHSFEEFLSRIPPEHLLNQLFMFSSDFSVDEAFQKISGLSHVLFVEDFRQGVDELSSKLNMKLNPIHTRRTSVESCLSYEEMKLLRSVLEPECVLYERLKSTLLQ
jgi:hypothetical protein